jgi:hypothetical protein
MYTLKTQALPAELQNLPEVEYPEEVIDELDREFEVVRAQIATGQAKVYSNVKDLFRDLKRDNG